MANSNQGINIKINSNINKVEAKAISLQNKLNDLEKKPYTVTINTKGIDAAKKDLKELINLARDATDIQNKATKNANAKNQLKNQAKELSKYQKTIYDTYLQGQKNLDKINKKMQNPKLNKDEISALKAVRRRQQKLNNETLKEMDDINKRRTVDNGGLATAAKNLQRAKTFASEIDAVTVKAEKSINKATQKRLDYISNNKQLKSMEDYARKFETASKAADKYISGDRSQQAKSTIGDIGVEELNKKRNELRVIVDDINKIKAKLHAGTASKDDIANFDKLKSNFSSVEAELKASTSRIKNLVDDFMSPGKNIKGFDKVGNRLTEWFNKYETQITKNGKIFDRYNTVMAKLNSGGFKSVEEANVEFAKLRNEARLAGVEVETIGSKLQRTFGSRVRSALAGEGVFLIQSALRDIVKNSVEVDTAMTELKKVTSGTDAVYSKFLTGASERAHDLGASLSEVVNATADYARLGYDIPEATTLADSALIYSNVGDDVENIDDATGALISTMQGFNIAASDSMSIVDRFNNVSNNYASSAGDIGEITKRSAASMAAAGNTIDETIALGVTANEVQQDAATVGTALKTIKLWLNMATCFEKPI